MEQGSAVGELGAFVYLWGSINLPDIWLARFPEGHYINQELRTSRRQQYYARRIFYIITLTPRSRIY